MTVVQNGPSVRQLRQLVPGEPWSFQDEAAAALGFSRCSCGSWRHNSELCPTCNRARPRPRVESTPIGDLVAAELAAARRREEDWARFGAACEARAEQARFDALQRALRRRNTAVAIAQRVALVVALLLLLLSIPVVIAAVTR